MESYIIEATKREKEKKDEQGKEAAIPGILYGKKVKNQMLWIDRKAFMKTYFDAGESSIIDLKIKNGKKDQTEKVLIYDLQFDSVTDEVNHVDFYVVRMDEEIETNVSLSFLGESPAVKELGGVLVKNIDEVEVRCLPVDLPHDIEVDISVLKTFEDYVYIKDLNISDKVSIKLDGNTVVALVSPPRSQEELEELEKEDESDITQVEGMEKEDDEQEEGEKDESSEGDEKEEKDVKEEKEQG